MEIIHSLDNDLKEQLQRHIEGLLHFDPVTYLPIEIFLQILSYLSPKDLLHSSTVSRSWRERAFDERLWQRCFAREGWLVDKESLGAWERAAQRYGRVRAEVLLTNGAPTAHPSLERHESRKRRRGEAFNDRDSTDDEVSGMRTDGTADEALDRPQQAAQDVEMDGLGSSAAEPPRPSSSESAPRSIADAEYLNRLNDPHHTYDSFTYTKLLNKLPTSPADLRLRPTIYQAPSEKAAMKLSWPYLYKQRRRLEANWDLGAYTTFMLPHIDHQNEGHMECVYTVQHTSRHLVSGSRDKTIRIWDLQTYRLKRDPLTGHDASVLCLQFDDRPEHDIIVSGGSDSTVIIWKFSTGEQIAKLDCAHEESVLNLRFDDRYIVTCSKDKTIRIWNRHPLPRDSELIPLDSRAAFADAKTSTRGGNDELIEPFTLLSTIHGHNAAVNAVQIHDNTIVSASGDRTVKAWDILTGKCIKNYSGHNKGIACVQFDGRRVVSGSSDNTVRIFDADQAAEVACLSGHQSLVRTVQARFGDMDIVTSEELADEAKEADRGWMKAVANGMQPTSMTRRAGPRSAGSSRPEDMLSVGAKIPPGGGGSKWAKIVSGSYDESVIVWKKDRDGNWVKKLTLSQNSILREARRHNIQPGPAQDHLRQVAAAAGSASVAHISANLHQMQHRQNPNTAHQQAAAIPNPHYQHMTAQQQQEAAANHPSRDSYRIFKLQFDARRIICCSQNKTIVGWDFANGDRELERIGDWSVETA
jgi:F-box and WD-40 domain protein 1/11